MIQLTPKSRNRSRCREFSQRRSFFAEGSSRVDVGDSEGGDGGGDEGNQRECRNNDCKAGEVVDADSIEHATHNGEDCGAKT